MIKHLAKTAFVAASVRLHPFSSPSVSLSLRSPSSLISRASFVASMVMPLSSSASNACNEGSCNNINSMGEIGKDYPELIVFDLDACLWDKEMYEMPALPSPDRVVRGDLNGRGEGVTGVYSGSRNIISLHKGSLLALQQHADNDYPNMKIALASSADTPFAEKIGRATLKLLEVVPGMTVWDLLMQDWDGQDVNQIGRQPPLSSNKAKSHFPQIRKLTNIGYDKMLFFDDCNWGDHCGMVEAACKDNGKGVTGFRTPNGLRVEDWKNGMKHYSKLHGGNK